MSHKPIDMIHRRTCDCLLGDQCPILAALHEVYELGRSYKRGGGNVLSLEEAIAQANPDAPQQSSERMTRIAAGRARATRTNINFTMSDWQETLRGKMYNIKLSGQHWVQYDDRGNNIGRYDDFAIGYRQRPNSLPQVEKFGGIRYVQHWALSILMDFRGTDGKELITFEKTPADKEEINKILNEVGYLQSYLIKESLGRTHTTYRLLPIQETRQPTTSEKHLPPQPTTQNNNPELLKKQQKPEPNKALDDSEIRFSLLELD